MSAQEVEAELRRLVPLCSTLADDEAHWRRIQDFEGRGGRVPASAYEEAAAAYYRAAAADRRARELVAELEAQGLDGEAIYSWGWRAPARR